MACGPPAHKLRRLDDRGPASGRDGTARPRPANRARVTPVEATFEGGWPDYYKYLQWLTMRGEVKSSSLVGPDIARTHWEERKADSMPFFNIFSTGDVLHASEILGRSLVYGTVNKEDDMFVVAHDARPSLLHLEPKVIVLEGDSAYVLPRGEWGRYAVWNLLYLDRPTEEFLPPPGKTFSDLLEDDESLQQLADRLGVELYLTVLHKDKNFRRHRNGKRVTRLSETTYAKASTPAKPPRVVVNLSLRQANLASPPILVGHKIPIRVDPLAPRKDASADDVLWQEEKREAKRRAKSCPSPPPPEGTRRGFPLHAKLNNACRDEKNCEFCSGVVPAIRKERNIRKEKELSPMFNPTPVSSSLELTQRIKSTGMDLVLPNLLGKIARARRMSMISWDVESLSHWFGPIPSSGLEMVGEADKERSKKAGVQLPFLIGTSYVEAEGGFGEARPELGQLKYVPYLVDQKSGVPTSESLERMVTAFLDGVFSFARKRAAAKTRLFAEEVEALTRMQTKMEDLWRGRNPEDARAPKGESTFLGRILPDLRSVANTTFVVGFNSSRWVRSISSPRAICHLTGLPQVRPAGDRPLHLPVCRQEEHQGGPG